MKTALLRVLASVHAQHILAGALLPFSFRVALVAAHTGKVPTALVFALFAVVLVGSPFLTLRYTRAVERRLGALHVGLSDRGELLANYAVLGLGALVWPTFFAHWEGFALLAVVLFGSKSAALVLRRDACAAKAGARPR